MATTVGHARCGTVRWMGELPQRSIARADGRGFALRFEDLDRVKEGAAERQLEDLAAIG
jgi:glutamyl-tRNA synthetase